MNARVPIAVALLLAVAGCGAAPPGGTESITVHTARIAGEASLLRSQLVAHDEAVASAPDLGGVADEETQFAGAAGTTLDALGEELQDLSQCSDPSGAAPDAEEIRKLVDAARTVTAAHGATMGGATTLAEAIDWEAGFQAAMAPLPPEMVDAAGRMSKLADVTCPAETDGNESGVAPQAATSASSEPTLHWGGCDCGRPPDPWPRALAPLPLLFAAGAWITRRAGA